MHPLSDSAPQAPPGSWGPLLPPSASIKPPVSSENKQTKTCSVPRLWAEAQEPDCLDLAPAPPLTVCGTLGSSPQLSVPQSSHLQNRDDHTNHVWLGIKWDNTWRVLWTVIDTYAESSASVHQCWIKSRRQSFGWRRKEELYCFVRQRGTQQAPAWKNYVSPPGRMWWGVL